MVKKLFPVLLIILMIGAWTNIITSAYSKPKQYNEYLCEGDRLAEDALYVKAVEQYKLAYSIEPSENVLDKILDSYQEMGDKAAYLSMCLEGIQKYPNYEKVYERVLEYYSENNNENFAKCAIEYKRKFSDNETINNYYKTAAERVYITDNMKEEPQILSQDMYLCFEDEYDPETQETVKYAVVKNLNGDNIYRGQYKNIKAADNGFFVQDMNGLWSLVSREGYLNAKTQRTTLTDICGKAAGFYVVINDGHYTLMNQDMQFAQAEYDFISCSSDGIYAVCKDGKWAIVDDTVISYEGEYPYDEVKINSNGYCSVNNRIVVKQDGKYKIINAKQETLLECSYEEVKAYEDTQPTVYKDKTGYGYMRSDGSVLIEAQFEDAMPYKGGVAAIKVNGKWGYIDQYGNVIVTPQFKEVTSILSAGKAFVLDNDGYWNILTIPILLYL